LNTRRSGFHGSRPKVDASRPKVAFVAQVQDELYSPTNAMNKLTDTLTKELLPIWGKGMVDYLLAC
jgi:hypothetical protein